MHTFPRLGGFKILLEADLDPLGVLVDVARMEKGDGLDGLKKEKLYFISILKMTRRLDIG